MWRRSGWRHTDHRLQVKPIEVKDCQYWVRRYVEALVEAGIMDAKALDVLATAPQH